MDPETGYSSETMLRFMADHGYKIDLAPPRDKHAGDILERMVGILTAKINNAMLENHARPSFWCWAMFKITQDLNFNYYTKIDTSPYNFITDHHIDIKYLQSYQVLSATCISRSKTEREHYRPAMHRDIGSWPTHGLPIYKYTRSYVCRYRRS